MSTFTLIGSGFFDLTPATTVLYASIVTLPPGYDARDTTPTAYFAVGSLRFEHANFYKPPVYFDSDQQWIEVPEGAEGFGFTVFSGGEITIVEGIPPAPPGAGVSSSADGTTVHLGDPITIFWDGITTAAVDDVITLTNESWDDPGGSYNYLASGWFYTSSGTQTVGSVPSTSGSLETTLTSPFPDNPTYLPQTALVKLYQGGVAPPAFLGPTFTFDN